MKVAIIGMGIVGRGAYEIICNELAPDITVKYVMDLRPPEDVDCIATTDIDQIISDPEVDLVVESIGGLHPAYEFITESLKAGKSVVTANKHLISKFYKELYEIAGETGARLQYTPSAGGGIPWLCNLKRTKRCGAIESFRGIINGTTNYILDRMTRTGADFEPTLKKAQELGYAEKDPTADIDGLDTQRKCVVSANLAFDAIVSLEDVPTAGIRYITDADIKAFDSIDRVCRLICRGEEKDGKISAYVEPTLFAPDALEANVYDNNNLVTLVAKYVGPLSFYGQGAGRYPTAHSMVEDIVDIYSGCAKDPEFNGTAAVDNSIACHRYYVRGEKISLPDDMVEAKLGDGFVTVPVSVEKMHGFASGVLSSGGKIFFAGFDE